LKQDLTSQSVLRDYDGFIGGAAGGRNVTVVNNISAVDAAGAAKFFRANSHSLIAAVNQGSRLGSSLQVSQQ
jgi:hypothetical protein